MFWDANTSLSRYERFKKFKVSLQSQFNYTAGIYLRWKLTIEILKEGVKYVQS